MLSNAAKEKLAELKGKYPTKEASILPALHVVFQDCGYLDVEQLDEAADIIGVSRLDINETATFYTLFPKEKVGKYLIQVCDNLSCSLMGADSLLEYLQEKLGIKVGETTPDGLFTLWTVECLGSCGTAPMMQVNDKYYERLSRAKVDELIEKWRST